MDKKSKILIWVFVVTIIASISLVFFKYIIKRDYTITANIDCDPLLESCFYTPCGDNSCLNDIEYYKKINKKAFNIKNCDSENLDCNPFVCDELENGCEIIYCSDDTISEEEQCSAQ